MAGPSARRLSSLPLALALGASALLLVSFVSSPAATQTFLSASPASSPRVRGHVAMHGFKDDFTAWKATLTPEERALSLEQAQNEYTKAFRKSDKYKQKLPEEKIKSLAKIVGKFLESEAEDYQKAKLLVADDRDELITKSVSRQNFDFRLTPRLIEIDRDAERRWYFASRRFKEAKKKGETFWPGSPQISYYRLRNSVEFERKTKIFLHRLATDAKNDARASPEERATAEAYVASLPPLDQDWSLELPMMLMRYWENAQTVLDKMLGEKEASMGKEAYSAWASTAEGTKEIEGTHEALVRRCASKYSEGFKLVEKDIEDDKLWFRSALPMTGKTKADMVRELWKLADKAGKKMPPLDEEILADLAKYPAYLEGEYKHSFGTADKLWKMEAIDAFGTVNLLGIFDTEDEAIKVFNDWNAEYEQARAKMSEETQQWEKKQDARLEGDREAQDRLRKSFDEAKRY